MAAERHRGVALASRLVFVHGVGGHRDADTERTAWLSALLAGARRAGHSDLSDLLADEGRCETVFAYYGDLFAPRGAQGMADAGVHDRDEAVMLCHLLDEVIDGRLAETDDPVHRQVLSSAKRELRPTGTAQGTGNLVRGSLNAATTLLSLPPVARGGQWLSGKLLVRDLSQVVRYLARREVEEGRTLDERIREILLSRLSDQPAVVVAHSLGTVVAFEALHHHRLTVPLLVTIGSPLGMRSVVWPKLRPQPPTTPACVDAWLNCWDRDDLVVTRPKLEADIAANDRQVAPESRRVDSDGVWVHTATKYLAHPEVGGRVAAALKRMAGRATGE
ncbi:hypothetical protein O7627_00910 [Solwaraspora sp. WMMD1047]|uniref:hypothetical protein n=1 Tax=Solwaraspora sp. WMMD1047 TaxID=3016102 RepID=UPI0024173192|nr:hypothetical protein [Solwaraspora sp. WMMD1047]MDG4827858.1 hypothetical protein [Solwaraspora sp. WMMD1047]